MFMENLLQEDLELGGVEDMVETEKVGDEHPSHVQDGGHPLCCDADQGRMVLPTPKIAVAYSAKGRGFCLIAVGRYPLHVYEQKDQDDYAVRRCHQIRPLWRLVPCTRSCPTEMLSTGMISTWAEDRLTSPVGKCPRSSSG
jgi:hypothetical protein